MAAKSFVFEYVIFFNPTSEYESAPEILDEGKIVAHDLERARLLAGRKIPEMYIDSIGDIEVLVRPFK